MHSKKHYIPVLLLFVAGAMAFINSFAVRSDSAQEVNIQFAAKGLPEQGLLAVLPSNPEHESLVATRFNRGNPILEAIRPFSVVIKNLTGQSVVAYSLRWELLRDDGRVLTQTRDYITLWKLMGVPGSDQDGNTIKANSFVLVAPSNIDINQITDPNAASDPDLLVSLSNERTELTKYTNITITIEGAFFEDGTYVGPDDTGFFAKVDAVLNAKRDLYSEAAQIRTRGANPDRVFKKFQDLADGPSVTFPSSPTKVEVYEKYKKDTATELLRLRSSSGDTQVADFATQMLKHDWPKLRKAQ